ncbi:hypothetical protein FGO68_gene11057 [Halteria grandinella]|uniref:Uncharacterized protein n=1 Tax=Halteria grandinella TaxID=5974 RepID=A0A8J8T0N3_HALGN|nr:hypothetical protein FGO68_gene11057 [Halteria grandinella]
MWSQNLQKAYSLFRVQYFIIQQIYIMHKAVAQNTLANIYENENWPMCPCNINKALFFCSKTCQGQHICCHRCLVQKHKTCDKIDLGDEILKHANNWNDLGENIICLYDKLREFITLWGLDLIKFTEKIVEPDNRSQNFVYKKRVIQKIKEEIEVELMANLRLEYVSAGQKTKVFFNTQNYPNRNPANEDGDNTYTEKAYKYLQLGQPPTKQRIEELILKYDIKSLIEQEKFYTWYKNRYNDHNQVVTRLSTLEKLYPEIVTISFTPSALATLNDDSLKTFLRIRNTHLQRFNRGNPQEVAEFMNLLMLKQSIDEEVAARHVKRQDAAIMKQETAMAKLQNEIARLQALINAIPQEKNQPLPRVERPLL